MEEGMSFGKLVHEFTLDDRRHVKEVLDRVFDEMGDAHEVEGMFRPYAEIVVMCLADPRIIDQLREDGYAPSPQGAIPEWDDDLENKLEAFKRNHDGLTPAEWNRREADVEEIVDLLRPASE